MFVEAVSVSQLKPKVMPLSRATTLPASACTLTRISTCGFADKSWLLWKELSIGFRP